MSDETAVASLLSLSVAAANAAPIPVSQDSAPHSFGPSSFNGPNSLPHVGNHAATAKVQSALKHRRLSSTGQLKRRLSDAREAASRPSAASIQTAAAALNSLATLSLAGSPPPQAVPQTSTSFTSALGHFATAGEREDSVVKREEEDNQVTSAAPKAELSAAGITIKNGNGKKRGTIYKCESCSKIYRHPSCLVKHRWEHSPHWREASKFLLSKHQQVQLLEAAAILSHMSPANSGGQSLPDDRSLWPSFLSNGLLAPPAPANGAVRDGADTPTPQETSFETHTPFRVSSSVPAQSALSMSRPTSTGPRMHDFTVPTSGVTHVRPGVVSVSTGSSPVPTPVPVSAPAPMTAPVPMPVSMTTYRDPARGMSVSSDRYGSPVSVSYSSVFGAQSYDTGGSWSLPRSSVRSRSTSTPKSDPDAETGAGEQYVEVDIEGEGDAEETYDGRRYSFISRGRTSDTRGAWKDEDAPTTVDLREEKIEEEWDGEMEMEM